MKVEYKVGVERLEDIPDGAVFVQEYSAEPMIKEAGSDSTGSRVYATVLSTGVRTYFSRDMVVRPYPGSVVRIVE